MSSRRIHNGGLMDLCIEALVLLGSSPVGPIAAHTGHHRQSVSDALKRLREKGTVYQTGTGPRNFVWHLKNPAAHTAKPKPTPKPAKKHRGAPITVKPFPKGHRVERPKTEKVSGESWWLGKNRAQLNAEARQQAERMNAAKEAKFVKGLPSADDRG